MPGTAIVQQLAVDADLENTTVAGTVNSRGIIYASPDRSFANTLSLRLTLDDQASSVPSVTIAPDPANAAVSLQFPDDVRVTGVSAAGFTAQGSGGSWALFNTATTTFDRQTPIDITLTGVTATQDDLTSPLAIYLPLPGFSTDAAAQVKLSFPFKPARGDRSLPLLVTATPIEDVRAPVIYVAKQDLSSIAAGNAAQPGYNAVLISICSGIQAAVPAVQGRGWHVRISFDVGDGLGDLLTPSAANLVQPTTTRDYDNQWASPHADRQALAVAAVQGGDRGISTGARGHVAFDYTVEGSTFLGSGAGNRVDITLEGLFPNDKEGYGNIYIEYRNLDGYQAGMVVVPVYKKSVPAIDLFKPDVAQESAVDGTDTYGPVIVANGTSQDLLLVWRTSALGPTNVGDTPVSMTMATGRQQQHPSGPAVVRSAAPLAAPSSDPYQGPNTATFSLPANSDPNRKDGNIALWWDGDAWRTLTLEAADSFGRSVTKVVYLEVKRPAPTIDFQAVPESIRWWTFQAPRVVWTAHEVDELFINGQNQLLACPDPRNGVAVSTPNQPQPYAYDTAFDFEVVLRQDGMSTAVPVPAVPMHVEPGGLTLTCETTVDAFAYETKYSNVPGASEVSRSPGFRAIVRETLAFNVDGTASHSLAVYDEGGVRVPQIVSGWHTPSSWRGRATWRVQADRLICVDAADTLLEFGDQAAYAKQVPGTLACTNERVMTFVTMSFLDAGSDLIRGLYLIWNRPPDVDAYCYGPARRTTLVPANAGIGWDFKDVLPNADVWILNVTFYIDGDKMRGIAWESSDGSHVRYGDTGQYPNRYEFSPDGTEVLTSCTITWSGYGYNTPRNISFATRRADGSTGVFNPGIGGGTAVVLDNEVRGRRIAGFFGATNPDNFLQSLGMWMGAIPRAEIRRS